MYSVRPSSSVALAEHQRTNAVRIAEGHHAVADDHRHAGVRAAQLLMHGGDRGKDVVGLQRVVREAIQLAGEHVEQDFRIGGGVDVAAVAFEQLLAQLMGVGQVAVVGQGDAVRRVDVERLGLRGAGAAGGRVTHVADPHIALQALHMAGLKHIVHQAVGLTQTEAVVCINGDDARSILPTVLKHR